MAREPLFVGVCEKLREALGGEFAEGSQLPGEHALARRFGVSVCTMRQALTALVHEGYLERRQGVGTTVKAVPQERWVAIYTERNVYSPDPSRWHTHKMGYIAEELERRGIPYRFYSGRRGVNDNISFEEIVPPTCREFLEDVARDRIAGVILAAADPHPLWADVLRERQTPVVGSSLHLPIRVSTAWESDIAWAVDELVKMGRRRIGMLCWSDRHIVIDPFLGALWERGLEVNPGWTRRDLFPGRRGAGWQQFREIWTASRVRPDGLIVADDCLLPDLQQATQALRIEVPKQLAIVGFTNRGTQQPCTLPMARVERDPQLHAQALVRLFLEVSAGDRRPREVLVPSRCVDVSGGDLWHETVEQNENAFLMDDELAD
jgi:hypothetical protein